MDEEILYKKCSRKDKCVNPLGVGVDLPLSEFYNSKDGKYGVGGKCKYCQALSSKLWYNKNPEERRSKRKEYYNNNIEDQRKYGREYWDKNREKKQEYDREYDTKNRDKKSQSSKERDRQLKIEVFNHYGGLVCNQCSCDIFECLTIDHINNDGAEHRKEIGLKGGADFYRWLKKNDYPEGFQVLCQSCNCFKQRSNISKERERLKVLVWNAYGGCVCKYCGETRLGCLSLDHINGGGRQDSIKNGGDIYKRLKRNNFPDQDKYQTLCMNCNFLRRLGIYPK